MNGIRTGKAREWELVGHLQHVPMLHGAVKGC
jgi:hypothetical protein